ncbi:MAG: hypothetical protein WC506_01880 [Candidatus Micrarchaeia archaeon]
MALKKRLLITALFMTAMLAIFMAGCSQQQTQSPAAPQSPNGSVQGAAQGSQAGSLPSEQVPAVQPANPPSSQGTPAASQPEAQANESIGTSNGVGNASTGGASAPAIAAYVLVNGTEFIDNLTANMPNSYYFRETISYSGFTSGGDFWYKNGSVAYKPTEQPPGDTITFIKKNGRLYLYSEKSMAGTIRALDSFSNTFARSASYDELEKLVPEAAFATSGFEAGINHPITLASLQQNLSNATSPAQNESGNVTVSQGAGAQGPSSGQNVSMESNASSMQNNSQGANASENATAPVQEPQGLPGEAPGALSSSVPAVIFAGLPSANVFPQGYFYARNETVQSGGRDCVWYYFVKATGKMDMFCMDTSYPVPLSMQIEDPLGVRSIIITGFVPADVSDSAFSIPDGVNITPYVAPGVQEYANQTVPPSQYVFPGIGY